MLRERTEAEAEAIGALYDLDWLAVPKEALECALRELAAPDAVFVTEPEPGQKPPRAAGIDAAVALFDAAREDWTSCRYLVESIDERDGAVLVAGKILAQARDTASRACFEFAHLWRTDRGRVVEVAAYGAPDDARAAWALLAA